MPTIKVKMSALRADQKYQPREELNGDEVQNYAELLKDGHVFPAPSVIDNKDGTYSLISGFHRFAAHKLNQSIDIDVEVLDLNPNKRKSYCLLFLSTQGGFSESKDN